MTVLEYLKIAFVFIGSLLIACFMIRIWTAQHRKNRLYKMAHGFFRTVKTVMDLNYDIYTPRMDLKEEISDEKVDIFLSKISIEDISADPFLKEVTDRVLAWKESNKVAVG